MPGLLALVDVMGSPCASMSRAKDPCGVHLTATPPSRLRQREIVFLGYFERALAATYHHNGQSDLLTKSRVVGGDPVRFARLTMRALEHLARKRLRCLRSPQPESIDRHHDVSVGIHSLERIAYR